MRHRKVISLYDADPSHAEILNYLESFEGRNRQANALMQLLVVGHRVLANLESGAEAYYHARNPDVRKVRKETPPRKTVQAPRVEREIPAGQVPPSSPPKQERIVIEEGEVIHPLPVKTIAKPTPIEIKHLEAPGELDIEDVDDPLMKLQMISGD